MEEKRKVEPSLYFAEDRIYFFLDPDLLGAWDKTEPASFLAVGDDLGLVSTLLASFAILGDDWPDLAMTSILMG